MATNSRFAIAVHVLTLLARAGDECLKSEDIARSVNTNAVVIRRLLRGLSRAALVNSQKGPCGGGRLTRHSNEITLLEVYRAVEGRSVFALHRQRPSRTCPVGKHIETVLEEVQEQMDAAIAGVLETITLDKIVKAVEPLKVRRIA